MKNLGTTALIRRHVDYAHADNIMKNLSTTALIRCLEMNLNLMMIDGLMNEMGVMGLDVHWCAN